MSMRRTAVLSAFWAAGESWALRGISAIVFLLLARLVDPAAFGLVALAAVYVSVMQALSDQGLAMALIQRETVEEEHKDSAFWANLGLGAALALVTLLLAEPAARLYGEPRLAPILSWFALSPFLASLAIVQQALMRRALRFRELALRQLLGAIAGGAVGLAMAFSGMGVWALVAQALVNQAVSVIVLWSIAGWRPRLRFSPRHFKDLFGFGVNVLAANMVRVIGFQTDRLLLGYFLGAAELGYYSVAQRVLAIVTDFVAGSAERIVVPLFARIQGDKERVRRGLMTAQRILSLVTIPAFVGLAAVAPSLVPVGVGRQWLASIQPTEMLAFASLGYCLSFFFGHVVTALGRPGVRLGVVVAQGLSQTGLVLFGVQYGVLGVALAVTVNQALFYVVELLVLRRLARFALAAYLREALLPLLAAAAMAVGVVLLQERMAGDPAAIRLAAGIAVGAVIYGAIILLFARRRLGELVDLAKGLRG
jgi:O-antigen/teichoic acid export membrane protein